MLLQAFYFLAAFHSKINLRLSAAYVYLFCTDSAHPNSIKQVKIPNSSSYIKRLHSTEICNNMNCFPPLQNSTPPPPRKKYLKKCKIKKFIFVLCTPTCSRVSSVMSKQLERSDLALQQVEERDGCMTFTSVSFLFYSFSFSWLDPKSAFNISFNVEVWLLWSVTLPTGLWCKHILLFVPLPWCIFEPTLKISS